MVIRRSPAFTSAPSRKWISCTAPATRERTSTRSTASSRPENSSQNVASRGCTIATETGVAAGTAAAGLLDCELVEGTTVNTTAPRTVTAAKAAPAPSRGLGKHRPAMGFLRIPNSVTFATYCSVDGECQATYIVIDKKQAWPVPNVTGGGE